MPDRLQTITDPLQSYIDYFLDVKPYHTKILEVLESYSFSEEMEIRVSEDLHKDITIQNDPLCEITGFGIIYDHPCGYDATNCCNLFDCYGGYGLVYDNSDLLVDKSLNDINYESRYVTIEGNHTVDLRIPIQSIPDNNTIIVDGDKSDLFERHNVMLVVNVAQIKISQVLDNNVYLDGDWLELLSPKKSFFIVGTNSNYNKEYHYSNVEYDSSNNQTVLSVSSTTIGDGSLDELYISVRNTNPNVGIYHPISATYDNTAETTSITLNSEYNLEYTNNDLDDINLGSIQLRTALKYNRIIEFSDNEAEHTIISSTYNSLDNETIIYLSGNLDAYDSSNNIKLYGYFFPSGYDGGSECEYPSESNIHGSLFEELKITIEDGEEGTIVAFMWGSRDDSGYY